MTGLLTGLLHPYVWGLNTETNPKKWSILARKMKTTAAQAESLTGKQPFTNSQSLTK